jgi:hypothetical protein
MLPHCIESSLTARIGSAFSRWAINDDEIVRSGSSNPIQFGILGQWLSCEYPGHQGALADRDEAG